MKSTKILVAVLAGLLGVAAVSSYADHAQVTISLSPASEDECAATSSCVSLSEVTIDAGGEIIWSNDGTVPVSITDGKPQDSVINSGTLNPAQTYALKFEESGEYHFSLASHPWMTGTITVVGDDTHDDHAEHGEATHDESGDHKHSLAEAEAPVGISVDVAIADGGGLNVHVTTDGWRWAPENVNGEPISGEGHAHIYVDGVKISRIYGPYHHVEALEPGSHHIRVTLNANNHDDLTIGGLPVEASAVVVVPEHDHGTHDHDPDPVTGTALMSVDMVANKDPLGGFNLQVITTDFVLSGQNVDRDHVQGEGYAIVSIDGEHHARLYEQWLKIPALEPGTHTITISLYANNHAPYHWDGEPIGTSITVHVTEEDGHMEGGDGHTSHDDDHMTGDGETHGSSG